MKISFHGATRSVTGSCHLIECNGKRVLIDCGLYQGGREIVQENSEAFGFEPDSIDFLLLTHAHLDHCGRVPLLAKRGFIGEVITTSASVELARLVMLDSAGLQEEDASYRQRRAKRHQDNNNGSSFEPLYTTLDALNSLDFFGRKASYGAPLQLTPGIRGTFFDAGHILGSASVLLELQENDKQRRVLFSGDLGFAGRAILADPAVPPAADVVVMETTYGDRLHKQLDPSIHELYDAINSTMERGGNVIIPSFALERAQEVLYYLREGLAAQAIPRAINVFLDSPMAISATEIFRRHPECYDEQALELDRDPFAFPGLHFTRETAESIALNQIDGGAVIMAGSGMCTGGRVRHHLRQNLGQPRNAIVFVGYAANGTLARRIVDGADSVRIFGDDIPVRASIHTINGFSAHADQSQLLAWHAQTGGPGRTFLVHGDSDTMDIFEQKLTNTKVLKPELHESFEL